MEKVPYIIEKNEDGSFAVIENPTSEKYGVHGWAGDRVVRSPFKTEEDARNREQEIATYWEYEIEEVPNPQH